MHDDVQISFDAIAILIHDDDAIIEMSAYSLHVLTGAEAGWVTTMGLPWSQLILVSMVNGMSPVNTDNTSAQSRGM